MHPLGRLPLWGREGVTLIVIESEGGDKRMSGQDKKLPRENREFRQSKKMRLKKKAETPDHSDQRFRLSLRERRKAGGLEEDLIAALPDLFYDYFFSLLRDRKDWN